MEGVLIAWLAGVTWQLCQARLWKLPVYLWLICLAALCIIGVYCEKKKRHPQSQHHLRLKTVSWQHLLIWTIVACMGFAWAGVWASLKQAGAIDSQLELRDLQVVGRIDSLPQLQSGRWRFVFTVEQAQLDGQMVSLPQQVMLSWYFQAQNADEQKPMIRAGQRWAFDIRLRAPHGYMNPHGFDYELWLWEQGIGAVGYIRAGQHSNKPELLNSSVSWSMTRLREAVRTKIFQTVNNSEMAGLLSALTLGDQQSISREDWKVFRITGIAHLVSISGLHITMMAWLAYGVIGWLWRRHIRLMLWLPAHMAALAGGLLCAAFYAWFAGWAIPAQRTVLMLAVVVLLRFLGARWPWYSVWLFVAAVVVAVDPWAILQAGFWLSFIAVGVLLAQSSSYGGYFVKEEPSSTDSAEVIKRDIMRQEMQPLQLWWEKMLGQFQQGLWSLVSIQWRISIALAPLTLLLFNQVSIVGLFANLFAIPWVTWVMVPLALGGIFVNALWHLAAWTGHVLMLVLQWCAHWPWAVWKSAQPPFLLAILAIVGGVAVVLPFLKWRYRLAGAFFIILALVWLPSRPQEGHFEVRVLDVGQGSAVLVRTATHAMLYDAGPRYSADSDAGDFLIVPALRALGVQLNRVVVSHADQDHAGGVISVLMAYPDADLLLSAPEDNKLWELHALQKQICIAGDWWEWDGVMFAVLAPPIDARKSNQADPRALSTNAQSCVIRISTQEANNVHAVLLTGDIEAPQEQALADTYGQCTDRNKDLMCADLLLMPHHGSKSSSTEIFLHTVQPLWAIAQVGYLNRFGHPAAEVVGRYQQNGILVTDTAICGAALWQSTQPDVVQCEREQRRRYWHWSESR